MPEVKWGTPDNCTTLDKIPPGATYGIPTGPRNRCWIVIATWATRKASTAFNPFGTPPSHKVRCFPIPFA